ncbi:hypothetical protein NM688_g2813 [Phlebia brevispora]|uniref:Uncharacterized protein n=1 Tax=Phlebia brevispora TaxID=194682 RepID=A0ACC1T7Q8_9APHY|nr:hypothetical protein NM688_g2813 [Phlebia brevispora]
MSFATPRPSLHSPSEKDVDIMVNEEAGPSSPLPQVERRDEAYEVLGNAAIPTEFTTEESIKVLRKIDLWLMPVIVMVYFLQQLDKSSLSYTSVFNIVQETHLIGQQYSWLGSIVYVAQLVWQPVSSYLLVRLPVAKYLFFNVFMWGIIIASSAAAHDFRGLVTARFFLGIFEATVAPCFITITQMWWRRREQTLRLSIWFAANGATGMVSGDFVDTEDKQIPTFTGMDICSECCATSEMKHHTDNLPLHRVVIRGPVAACLNVDERIILPDSPTKAKFLNQREKLVAIERLRANNMGTETKVWKWPQVWEVCADPKTYLWFAMLFLCALPSGGISSFGPLIIKGFGFNQFDTLLFNIPFSAFQVIIIVLSAWISMKIQLKWPVVFCLCLPPIAGSSALLVMGRAIELKNKLLGVYYVLSFFSSIQPMLYTWSSQNTAGHTKKLCVVFVAQCAGNIIGPLLYTTEEAPYYHRGLTADLICWIVLCILVLVTAAYLKFLNMRHIKGRRLAGMPTKIIDTSLSTTAETVRLQYDSDKATAKPVAALNSRAFEDLTDLQNVEFVYVL